MRKSLSSTGNAKGLDVINSPVVSSVRTTEMEWLLLGQFKTLTIAQDVYDVSDDTHAECRYRECFN